MSTSSVSADVPTADSRGQERSAESFADFVAARLGTLTRTAVLLCGDRTRADDLVQSVLVKTAAAWPRVETNPDAYVRRALYHEQISWWQRRNRRLELLTWSAERRVWSPLVTAADPDLMPAGTLLIASDLLPEVG